MNLTLGRHGPLAIITGVLLLGGCITTLEGDDSIHGENSAEPTDIEFLTSANPDDAPLERDRVATQVRDHLRDLGPSHRFRSTKVKVFFTQLKPSYVLAFRLRADSYLIETVRLDLDADYNVTGIQEDYHPSDDELDAGLETYASTACPDPSVEFFVATCLDDYPTAVAGVRKVAELAQQAGYKVKSVVGGQASTSTYKAYLSCPNLKGFGNVGHGLPNGIQLSDGMLSSTHFKGLANTALNNKLLYFNSCQTHKAPLEPAIVAAGVQKFIGGDVDLLVGKSEDVFKCFWGKVLKQEPITASLRSCEREKYPRTGDHGISGNGSDIFDEDQGTDPTDPGTDTLTVILPQTIQAGTPTQLSGTAAAPITSLRVYVDGYLANGGNPVPVSAGRWTLELTIPQPGNGLELKVVGLDQAGGQVEELVRSINVLPGSSAGDSALTLTGPRTVKAGQRVTFTGSVSGTIRSIRPSVDSTPMNAPVTITGNTYQFSFTFWSVRNGRPLKVVGLDANGLRVAEASLLVDVLP